MAERKHILAARACTAVLVLVGIKLVVQALGWEVMSINPLFSGIVAANVFLMGFLLSGVLADYKESERLPGEMAACLETLIQEVKGIKTLKAEANIVPCMTLIAQLTRDTHSWFYKKYKTLGLMEQMNDLIQRIAVLEVWAQSNTLARLKQEVGSLRRTVIRVHTIRDTSFISSGYLLADVTTSFLCLGLLVVKIGPRYDSLFFVGVISFLMIYLRMLIRDLDNPFGYYEVASEADVSLKPIEDLIARLDPPAQAG